MPSVQTLEQYLFLLEFWRNQKEHYLRTPVDFYTQSYISARIAEADQHIAELQVLIQEQIIVWAGRRPPPPQQ